MAGAFVRWGALAGDSECWETPAGACTCRCPPSTGIRAREVVHAAGRAKLNAKATRSSEEAALMPSSMPDVQPQGHRCVPNVHGFLILVDQVSGYERNGAHTPRRMNRPGLNSLLENDPVGDEQHPSPSQAFSDDEGLESSNSIELIALAMNERTVRCRLLGSDQRITLRAE